MTTDLSVAAIRVPECGAGAPRLEEIPGRGWWFRRWAAPHVVAGITDRALDASRLLERCSPSTASVAAEQVHGASVAVIGRSGHMTQPVGGADALLTDVAGVALMIRTADCLPILFADSARGAVGIAHAGWRGLAAALPARVVAAFRHAYHSRAEDVRIAIGPAIRACCYEVGQEFVARFGAFVRERGGRRTCDLVGIAVDQLRRCGIRPDRITDPGQCTACHLERWYSLRREGPATGRLTSLILLRS